MARIDLSVSGMHCAGCSATVQRALEDVEGVDSAAVSMTDGLARIEGDDALQVALLIEAIRRSGYDAVPARPEQSASELRSRIEERQIRNERLWRQRAMIGLGVWIPMAVLHWGNRWLGIPEMLGGWIGLAGATAVLVLAGGGFYRSAWSAARRGTTNMDTLIAIGATTAYLFSLYTFIARLAGSDASYPLYFTEAAALLGIISLGHWMEARASARAGSAVRELLELQPDKAERIGPHNAIEVVSSTSIDAGDRILIRPGMRVPVDGIVVEGDSDIDEAVVTGESMPVYKVIGDTVLAGTVNTTGRLEIEASSDGRKTTIMRIAAMVQEAQSSKANIQRLADRVCAVFVPAVLVIALATFVGWWIAGDPIKGVISTVTVLIISCPCALGLATPMAVMVGTGTASRLGILIKSAMSLERAGTARCIVFDKTGTLTAGHPVVTSIDVESLEYDDRTMLQLAASVEAVSEHPIARAIVQAAYARDVDLLAVGSFKSVPGKGVHGVVASKMVEVWRDESAACQVRVNGEVIGRFGVLDAVREDAAQSIEALRQLGLEVRMLSGDRPGVAMRIADTLNLYPTEVHAEATPESKQAMIAELGPGTLMVGDGINDAAALASADVGIAMASGTNIAIESADIVIPGDRVLTVAETVIIARRTLLTIKQNLFFAFLYNGLAIPAAAFGLLGMKGPIIAAIAMGLSDITVIGNALRLKMWLRDLGR